MKWRLWLQEMNKICLSKYQSGVYVLYGKGKLLYIGETSNLYLRIGQHIKAGKIPFDNIEFYPFDENKRKYIEGILIKIYLPKYNIKNAKDEIMGKFKPKQRLLKLFGKSDNYNENIDVGDVENVITWILKRR